MIGFSKYFQFCIFSTAAGRQPGAQTLLLFLLLLLTASCKKYLDAKPDKKLVVPTTIQDLQGILDYYDYMNMLSSEAGEIASDNYYLTDASYQSLSADRMRDAYLWKPGLFTGMTTTDWQNEYTIVYNANVVLDNIGDITRSQANASDWDNCKGSALFFRAKSFYEISQIWTKAYDSSSANTDLGIPLRVTSDFNKVSVRASVQETYNQIIRDLKEAISLLPNNAVFVYRPTKPAAYGLLARTYLTMRSYSDAFKYADSCLQIKSGLFDFNNLNPALSYPFQPYSFSNPEDLMHSIATLTNLNMAYLWGRVDSTLYQSYESNDLRKTIYFATNSDGSHYFRGSYDATNIYNYNGIATDEIYLIRAECYARQGNVSAAMNDLNALLVKRWKSGSFIPLTANSSSDALSKVLSERRKELLFRMLRFSDIKRLNKEGANIVLKRIIQGQTYILQPNDSRYALPIPENVIQLSGIQQN